MDDRWIKCPSKTFPNKYYYFNPYTGSAVWSLNDKPSNIVDHSRTQYPRHENFQNTNSIFSPVSPYFSGVPYGGGFPLAPYWINQPVCVMPVPVPVHLKEQPEFMVQTTSIPLSVRFHNLNFASSNNNQSDINVTGSNNNDEEQQLTCNHEEKGNITDAKLKSDMKRKFPYLGTNFDIQPCEVPGGVYSKLRRTIHEPQSIKDYDETIENIDHHDVCIENIPRIDVSCLNKCIEQNMHRGMWYIIADTDVLLYRLTFIEKLVKSDPTCRLMVPQCVLREVNSISSLSHRHVRVGLARKVNKFLSRELPTRRTVIAQTAQQAKQSMPQNCTSDKIMQCCKQLLDQQYFVVLISDNGKLRHDASLAKIQSYSINQLVDIMKEQHQFNSCQKLMQNKDNMYLRNVRNTDTVSRNGNQIHNSSFTINNNMTEHGYNKEQKNNNDKYEIDNKQKTLKLNKKTCQKITKLDISRDDENLVLDMKDEGFNCDSSNNVDKGELDEKRNSLERLTFDLSFGSMLKKYGDRESKEKILKIQDWNRRSALDMDKVNETMDKKENRNVNNKYRNPAESNREEVKVKQKLTRNRMALRVHKWALRLSDVMVEALSGVLKEKCKQLAIPAPKSKSLHSLAEAVKVYYRKNEEIRKTAGELMAYSLCCIGKEDLIRSNLKLKKFMKLFSHSYDLLLSLKSSKDIQKKEDLDVSIDLLKKILLEMGNTELHTAKYRSKNVEAVGKPKTFNGNGKKISNMKNSSTGISEPLKTTELKDQIQSTVVRTIGHKVKLITLTRDKRMVVNHKKLKPKEDESFLNIKNDSKSVKLTSDKNLFATVRNTGEEDDKIDGESANALKNIKNFDNMSRGPAAVNDINNKNLNSDEKDYTNSGAREVVDLDILNYSPMSLEIIEDDVHSDGDDENRFEKVNNDITVIIDERERDSKQVNGHIILSDTPINTQSRSDENDKSILSVNGMRKIDDGIIITTEESISLTKLGKVVESVDECSENDAMNRANIENDDINKADDSGPGALFETKEQLANRKENVIGIDTFEETHENFSKDKTEKNPLSCTFNGVDDLGQAVTDVTETDMRISDIEILNEIVLNRIIEQSENEFTSRVNINNLQSVENNINLESIDILNEVKEGDRAEEFKKLTKENEITLISKENQFNIKSLENECLSDISVGARKFTKDVIDITTNETLVNDTILNNNKDGSLIQTNKSNSSLGNNVIDSVTELKDIILETGMIQKFCFVNDVDDFVNDLKETDVVNHQNVIRDKNKYLNISYESNCFTNDGNDVLTNPIKGAYDDSINISNQTINAINTLVIGQSISDPQANCRSNTERNEEEIKSYLTERKVIMDETIDVESHVDKPEDSIKLFDTNDVLKKIDSKSFLDIKNANNIFNDIIKSGDINRSLDTSNDGTRITTDEVQRNIDCVLLDLESLLEVYVCYQKNNQSIRSGADLPLNECDVQESELKEKDDSDEGLLKYIVKHTYVPKPSKSMCHRNIKKNRDEGTVIKDIVNDLGDDNLSVVDIDRLKTLKRETCVSSINQLQYENSSANCMEAVDREKITNGNASSKRAKDVLQNAKKVINTNSVQKEVQSKEDDHSQSETGAIHTNNLKFDSEEDGVSLSSFRDETEVIDKCDNCQIIVGDLLKELNETFHILRKYIDDEKSKLCDADAMDRCFTIEKKISNVMKLLKCIQEPESIITNASSSLLLNAACITGHTDGGNASRNRDLMKCLIRAKVLKEKFSTLTDI